MVGIITRPTAEQKELLFILGKTEKDAPTKEYADYYLNNIDLKRKETGLLSLQQLQTIHNSGDDTGKYLNVQADSVHMNQFNAKSKPTPSPKEIVVPSDAETEQFIQKLENLSGNWPKMGSVANKIARIQVFASGNNMQVIKEKDIYVLQSKDNSLISVPLISINSEDKKAMAELQKNIFDSFKVSFADSINSLYEAEKENADIIHKIAVWFTQTDEITPDGFAKVCADNCIICNKNFLVMNGITYKANLTSTNGIADTICNIKKINSESIEKLKEIKREFRIQDKVTEKQKICRKMKM